MRPPITREPGDPENNGPRYLFPLIFQDVITADNYGKGERIKVKKDHSIPDDLIGLPQLASDIGVPYYRLRYIYSMKYIDTVRIKNKVYVKKENVEKVQKVIDAMSHID